jgi:hypothetical protein
VAEDELESVERESCVGGRAAGELRDGVDDARAVARRGGHAAMVCEREGDNGCNGMGA